MQYLPDHLTDALTSVPVNGIIAQVSWGTQVGLDVFVEINDTIHATQGPSRALSAVHLKLSHLVDYSVGETSGEQLARRIAEFITEVFRRKVVGVAISRKISTEMNIKHDEGRMSPVSDKDKIYFRYGESYNQLSLI